MSTKQLLSRKKVMLVLFFGILLGLASFLVTLVSYRGTRPSPSPRPSPQSNEGYQEMVTRGDEAFRSHNYDRAMIFYEDADRTLSESLRFENESPSKDEPVLQHYHNAKTVLRAKMELTLLAEDVSRLKSITPPEGAK
jgi:hypothetical protein